MVHARLSLGTFALVLGACGREPPPACSLRCSLDGRCPDGLQCSGGFCASDDNITCEPTFATIAAGTGFACALDQFGRVWCWGANTNAQQGDVNTPVQPRAVVAGQHRWDALSVGGGHVCGLDDTELYCWGRNRRSEVTSTIAGDIPGPFRIEIPGQTASWSYASAGPDNTCGIADGRLFCWGAGTAGKLGAGDVDDAEFPQLVQSELADWIQVAAGARHTCAVSRSIGLFCWGDGSAGQLGNGVFGVADTPEFVPVVGHVVSLALGLHSTCAVNDDGDLFCWGRAADGALGDPRQIDPDGGDLATPRLATTMRGWREVAAGQRYACARREVPAAEPGAGTTEVWCWGTASAGGIGDGTWRATRAFAKVLDGARALSIGWNASDLDQPAFDTGDQDLTCAIVDGDVRCWGDNRSAQLGQGGATGSVVPVAIAGDHAWSSVVAGADHACGIAGGDVYCWGSIERGQVSGAAAGASTPCTTALCSRGAPVRVIERASAVAAGPHHTCALRGDVVTCWGDNTIGQCGVPAGAPVIPSDVPGTWTALFATGGDGTCALGDGGAGPETWCWGAVLGIGAPDHEPALDGVTAVALGAGFGCALGPASELACFGDAPLGNGGAGSCPDGACNAGETAQSCPADCGPPPLTHLDRRYTALAAGRRAFACGVTAGGHVECWGDNAFGQAGAVDDGGALVHPALVPFALSTLTGCTQVATGSQHACAICGGALACWGDASHGELGAPVTLELVTAPRTIAAPLPRQSWIAVAVGDGFTCGTLSSGRGFCWGTSNHGALGNGYTGANLPVTVQR